MADVILDQLETGEINHYYGSKWQPSTLVEGGFECEEFFEHLGNGGKWLFFTAAPIKASDGTIVGAIETLWDNTEKQRAETQRRKYVRRVEDSERTLSQIIQGSTIPTFVLNRDHVVTHWNRALKSSPDTRLPEWWAHAITGSRSGKMNGSYHGGYHHGAIREEELHELYGERWRKSKILEEATKPKPFFPSWVRWPVVLVYCHESENSRWYRGRGRGDAVGYHGKPAHGNGKPPPCSGTGRPGASPFPDIQGSTTPTFVINRNHIVTHWNRALGKTDRFCGQ